MSPQTMLFRHLLPTSGRIASHPRYPGPEADHLHLFRALVAVNLFFSRGFSGRPAWWTRGTRSAKTGSAPGSLASVWR